MNMGNPNAGEKSSALRPDLRALLHEADTLRLAAEAAALGVWDLNPDSQQLRCCESACAIFGLPPRRVYPLEMLLARLHPRDRSVLRHLLSAAGPAEAVCRLVHPNGQTTWVELRARRDDASGAHPDRQRLVGTVRDVTPQRQAEQRLRESNRRLVLLSETAWRLLQDTDTRTTIDAVCQRVMAELDCHVFFHYLFDEDSRRLHLNAYGGIPRETARTVEWLDVGEAVCGAVAREGRRHIAECVRSGRDAATELVRSLGVQAYACHPLLSRGRVIGTLSFGTRTRQQFSEDDLTVMQTIADHVAVAMERLRFEEDLRQANRQLEQRARQLRSLASELTQAEQRERRRLAQVLHDHLQQILVGAKFGLGMLARRYENDEPGREQVQHVRSLLDEAIGASRSLTVELCPPVLYDGQMADVLEWLAHWMEQNHGLSVTVRTEDGCDPSAEDVRVLLFQSVRELLFNVVKHSGASRAEIELAREGDDLLRLRVRDDGHGFDPTQAEADQQDAGGFGLFSVQERLQCVGGRVEIDAAPGRGCQVTLLAPLSSGHMPPPAEAATPAPAPAPTMPGTVRVLLVDDHEIVRDGLKSLLAFHEGIEVVGEASDGRQALEQAKALRPDVVVMDVNMPGLGGVEATRRIRRLLPATQVIALSMFDEADAADRMRDAGAVAYLQKAGAVDELVQAIRQAAARR